MQKTHEKIFRGFFNTKEKLHLGLVGLIFGNSQSSRANSSSTQSGAIFKFLGV